MSVSQSLTLKITNLFLPKGYWTFWIYIISQNIILWSQHNYRGKKKSDKRKAEPRDNGYAPNTKGFYFCVLASITI